MEASRRRINPALGALALGLILLPGNFLPAQGTDTAPPPDNDHSPYHLALLDYKEGKYQEALDALKPLGNSANTDERTAILKGRILTEMGQYEEGKKVLAPLLTPQGPLDVALALGDLLLRQRDFNAAARVYDLGLTLKPGDPDLLLLMVYTRVGANDLTTASKIASRLKPLDPSDPSYYFAKAALAQATDKSAEADDNIQTVRTMYGITTTNHYLKQYLELFSAPAKNSAPPAASTNAAPAKP